MAERMSRAAMDAGIADTNQQMRDAFTRVEAEVARHWGWYLALGIALLLAGMAAIAFPLFSTIAAKIALNRRPNENCVVRITATTISVRITITDPVRLK